MNNGKFNPTENSTATSLPQIGQELEWRGSGESEVAVEKSSGAVRVKVNPRYYRPTEVRVKVNPRYYRPIEVRCCESEGEPPLLQAYRGEA